MNFCIDHILNKIHSVLNVNDNYVYWNIGNLKYMDLTCIQGVNKFKKIVFMFYSLVQDRLNNAQDNNKSIIAETN